MPEHLPTPAESIAELERKQRQVAERQATPLPHATQGSLFDDPGDEE